MDSAVFKIEKNPNERGVIEDYSSRGGFYDKNFPDFAKFTVHNHDSLFTDSVFYYYKNQLVKFMYSTHRDDRILDSTTLYFEDTRELESEKKVDSSSIKEIIMASERHLTDLKKVLTNFKPINKH
ncbi:MAG TPA: hypothetical protein VK588_07015 [Chitinophagaceae bacterium]|nr:hypothetical protein [Chitinophagaceae bacterium]